MAPKLIARTKVIEVADDENQLRQEEEDIITISDDEEAHDEDQLRQEEGHQEQHGEVELPTCQEDKDVITISDDEETEASYEVQAEAEAQDRPQKAGGSGLKKRQLQENNLEVSSKAKKPRLRYLPYVLSVQRINEAIAKANSTTEENKAYSCHICEMTFSLRAQLRNHIACGRHEVEGPSEKDKREDHDAITISDDDDVVEEHQETNSVEPQPEQRGEPEARQVRNSSTLMNSSASTRNIIASCERESQAVRIRHLSILTAHSDNEDESTEAMSSPVQSTSPRYSKKSEVLVFSEEEYDAYLEQEMAAQRQRRLIRYSSNSENEGQSSPIRSSSPRFSRESEVLSEGEDEAQLAHEEELQAGRRRSRHSSSLTVHSDRQDDSEESYYDNLYRRLFPEDNEPTIESSTNSESNEGYDEIEDNNIWVAEHW